MSATALPPMRLPPCTPPVTVEAGDRLLFRGLDFRLGIDGHAAHAVMDARGDQSGVEGSLVERNNHLETDGRQVFLSLYGRREVSICFEIEFKQRCSNEISGERFEQYEHFVAVNEVVFSNARKNFFEIG